MNQCTFSDTYEVWLRFVLIESSDQEPQKGAVKRSRTIFTDQGRFSPIKILDPSRKRFYRQRVCDYPLYWGGQ